MHLVTVGAGAVIPTLTVSSPIVLFDCSNLQNVPNMLKTHGIWMPLLFLRHYTSLYHVLFGERYWVIHHQSWVILIFFDKIRRGQLNPMNALVFESNISFYPEIPSDTEMNRPTEKKKNCTHQPHLFGIPSKLVGWPNAEEDDGKSENQMVDWWDFHLDCWLAEVWVEVFSVPCRRGVVLRFL